MDSFQRSLMENNIANGLPSPELLDLYCQVLSVEAVSKVTSLMKTLYHRIARSQLQRTKSVEGFMLYLNHKDF